MKCSEHLMDGNLPIAHPMMTCVVSSPACVFLDASLVEAEERRLLASIDTNVYHDGEHREHLEDRLEYQYSDWKVGDCTPYRDFPLECIPNSTPVVRMRCMMGYSNDIPEADRGAYYVHTEWQYAYYWVKPHCTESPSLSLTLNTHQ